MDTSKGQTPESVRAHAVEHQLPFTVMRDSGQAAQQYGASAIAFLALIDADGLLRWSDNPANPSDGAVEALLDGQPIRK